MNLIVRSQDKEILLAVNNLSIKKKKYEQGFKLVYKREYVI